MARIRTGIKRSYGWKAKKWFKDLWDETTVCIYCQREMLEEDKTADHINPHCNGKSNSRQNIQIICKLCNTYKGTMPHREASERINMIMRLKSNKYQME